MAAPGFIVFLCQLLKYLELHMCTTMPGFWLRAFKYCMRKFAYGG